jgi:Rod binding domain-containing protein
MKPVQLPTLPGELAEAKPVAHKAPSEKALKAAREFESMLLRHVLESLQKTTHAGKQDHSTSAYQSMAVEAMADGVTRGGGLGLADLIAKTLESEMRGGGSR